MFLAEEGYSAEGLDYSGELIDRLRDEYPEHTWHQGMIQSIPQPSAAYDAVISWGVIEHDENGPAAALAEYRRVLRPGGIVVVTVPVDTTRQRRSSRLQFPEDQGGTSLFFQYFFTPGELREEVASAGFEIVESSLVPQSHEALIFPRLYARFKGSRVASRALRAGRRVFGVNGYENMTYCVGRVPVETSPRAVVLEP